MSFGSDSPGGSVEGIGGNESGMGSGGNGYSGGWEAQVAAGYQPGVGGSTVGAGPAGEQETRVGQAIAQMSVPEQERFFREVIEPAFAKREGIFGKASEAVMQKVISGLLNAVAPGVGTLAGITGVTGKAVGALSDAAFSQNLAEQLGISSTYGIDSSYSKGDNEGIINAALQQGVPSERIQAVYNNLLQQQYGGSMGLWEDITGATSESAALGAAGTQASYQQQAIDYLKQMGAAPMAAQQQLSQLYGLTGTPGEQQQAVTGLRQSPIYGAIMGGQQAGEEAIMRQAGATGGLRSGNVQGALADYSTQLENQALMQSLGGLGGLASMSTYAGDIGTGMAGIGQILGAGQIGAAQAGQAGTSNLLGLAGAAYQGLGGLGGITEGLGSAWDWASDAISGWF